MSSERTPLLQGHARNFWDFTDQTHDDEHSQFCKLTGCPPSNLGHDASRAPTGKTTLYGRALRQRKAQNLTYLLTASLSNTLLLSQVVLGAALTALGASESSHILITVFGALNTIIAGVVAYLKSRGQPMRARMYRDDLERVVDEIENSEIMWRGISHNMHGYAEIDTDSSVTVRSEVARLTRLYDRAVRNNTMNNPDMYMAGAQFDPTNSGLRSKNGNIAAPVPVVSGAVTGVPVSAAPSAPVPPQNDPDQSPASAPPKPPTPPPKEEVQEVPKPEPKPDSKDDSKSDGDASKSEAGSSKTAAEKPKAEDTTTGKESPKKSEPLEASTSSVDPDASPASTDPPPTAKSKEKEKGDDALADMHG